ncbi:hypothetical protein ACA910_005006 [Epithemia clementina (nom. ined.)]
MGSMKVKTKLTKTTENEPSDDDKACDDSVKVTLGVSVEEIKQKKASRETVAKTNGDAVPVDKTTKKLSKRQQLKQVNNKNLWPQQPRISSAEARAKAYLRVSGLTQTPKDLIPPDLDLHSPSVRFSRQLASPEQRKRHQAVLKLQMYLKERCDIKTGAGVGISEMDLLRLWKALWHTLYMADKVPVQEELSEKLANLIWCVAGTEEEDEYAGQAYLDLWDSVEDGDMDEDMDMEEDEDMDGGGDEEEDDDDDDDCGDDGDDDDDSDVIIQGVVEGGEEDDKDDDSNSVGDSNTPHCRGAHLAALFLRTFLVTVRREWGRMDKYRVDKFYTLIRCIMHQVFKYMSLRHWNRGIIQLFNDAIFEEILYQKPNGLRYHLIDLALEELAKVHSKAPMPLTEATFLDCLEPYFAMAQSGGGGDDSVQKRVVENICEKFLMQYSIVSEVAVSQESDNAKKQDWKVDEKDNDAEVPLLFDQVHVGTIAQIIFKMASDAETPDVYRKSLYDLHKKYMRRLKLVGRDVDFQACLRPVGTESEEEEEEEEMDHGEEDVNDRDNEEVDDRGNVDGKTKEKGVSKASRKAQGPQPSGKSPELREGRDSNERTENGGSQRNGSKERKTKRDRGPNETVEDSSQEKPREQNDNSSETTPDQSSCKRKLFQGQVQAVDESKLQARKKRKKKKNKDNAEDSTESHADGGAPTTGAILLDREKKDAVNGDSANDPKSENEKAKREPNGIGVVDPGVGEIGKKKRKKAKKKRMSEAESDDNTGKIKKGANEQTSTKKPGDKKSNASNTGGEDEEVVISVKDQKKAKSAMNLAISTGSRNQDESQNREKSSQRTKKEQASPASKRVKFGAVNTARSWKASMKALRSANPSTPPAPPEQSILLNKSSTPRVVANTTSSKLKKRRSIASDYF